MNNLYLKFAMKPIMLERRSFEWLAAHMASNKAFKPIKEINKLETAFKYSGCGLSE